MIFGFGDAIARGREKAARTARGALADYYAVPVQPPVTPASELRLLAIDIETTGLDAAKDAVLSIGYLPIEGSSIILGGAANLVLAGSSVGQSATIHGLTDDVVAAGVPREEAVAATLAALAGRVLLAHHDVIEIGFLSRACVELYGAPFVTPSVDTMDLQRRIIAPGFNDEPRADDLRLWTARARYHLPRYGAHQATTDALACAELYLAQLAELRGTPTLKSLSA